MGQGAHWVACAATAAAGAGTLGLTNVVSLSMHKLQTSKWCLSKHFMVIIKQCTFDKLLYII